jgi:hypothetical protein
VFLPNWTSTRIMLHVSHSVCEMKNTKKLAVFFWAIL